jgi:hypothetical protein
MGHKAGKDTMRKQEERILRHLTKAGTLTELDAMRLLGCVNLAARIRVLVKAGHEIESDTVQARNQFGEFVGKSARYWMKGNTPGKKLSEVFSGDKPTQATFNL